MKVSEITRATNWSSPKLGPRLLLFVVIFLEVGLILGPITQISAQHEWKDVYSQKAWDARDEWQRPEDIIRHLKLSEKSRVADIGAHEGYFTMKLAKAVSGGVVYAVDISASKLERLKRIADEKGLHNVEAIHGKPDDPALSLESLDAVLIVDTYHEIGRYEAFLKNLRSSMKVGARLVICEPLADERKGLPRNAQTRRHELELKFAENDLRSAGFEILYTDENFVDRTAEKGDRMWLLVARKTP